MKKTKGTKKAVSLKSSESPYMYMILKNTKKNKLKNIRKYDPRLKKHVIFNEAK